MPSLKHLSIVNIVVHVFQYIVYVCLTVCNALDDLKSFCNKKFIHYKLGALFLSNFLLYSSTLTLKHIKCTGQRN